MLRVLILLGMLAPLSVGCSDDADACDGLAEALGAAGSGDTVELQACTVSGQFQVGQGVALVGSDGATLASNTGVGLTLAEGATVRGLRIETSGDFGIRIAGTATVDQVTMVATRGEALRVESGIPTIRNTTLTGPVTEANATSTPADATMTAVRGLVLLSSGMAGSPVTLEEVSVSGFGEFGVVAQDSHLVWNGGSASGNLGTGLMVRGGSANLTGVELCGSFQGVRAIPSYAGVFASGAVIETRDLLVCDNEGYGLLQDDATTMHFDLISRDNNEAGVWAQQGGSIDLDTQSMTGASATLLSGNRLGGLVLVNVNQANVTQARFEMTRTAPRIEPDLGEVRVGDGIHAVLPTATMLRINEATLMGNERAGVLLNLMDGLAPDGVFTNVTVDGTGAGLGVIAQSPTAVIPGGTWDMTIDRRGATAANDSMLTGPIDVVGIVEPMFLPRPM